MPLATLCAYFNVFKPRFALAKSIAVSACQERQALMKVIFNILFVLQEIEYVSNAFARRYAVSIKP
jgi:hypothetical protein